MNDLILWSKDHRFGLFINQSLLQQGIKECVDADYKETGGILIGYYNENLDCAIVTILSGPSKDSIKKPTLFIRGTLGIQNLINRAWYKNQHFYLGEWHYHPKGEPIPSHRDIEQMKIFSMDKKLNCPEPILLIIGGDPKHIWTKRAYVFPVNQEVIPLFSDICLMLS